MPHSNFKYKGYDVGSGTIRCSCGQTFNYASEREIRMKIRPHDKFCSSPTKDTSINEVPKAILMAKAMTLKEYYKNEAEEMRERYV